jgi:hypothetical protein
MIAHPHGDGWRRWLVLSPPKVAAFCFSVVGVSALTRVRDRRAERAQADVSAPADAEQLNIDTEPLNQAS